MVHSVFPPLPLEEWQASRDTIQVYSQVLGAIRRALSPPQKHWWHISLRCGATGLTTTPIPAGNVTFEILLDLTTHELNIATSDGDWWDMSLRGQSTFDFLQEILEALRTLDITVPLDKSPFQERQRRQYDTTAIEDYWQAASQIDILLKQFKGELREECGPVQLWPHHFDLALRWYSGRLVPDTDPNDPENADEQMAFGFSTGDGGTPEPYFYITMYPWQDALAESALPPGATWHHEGWKGALLPYTVLTKRDAAKEDLLNFWRTVQQAGAALTREKG
jgi:hypothetical protein